MKDYLKKLGKTKFQSYLMVTIINVAILIAWVMGKQIVESDLNPYTPVISLIVQLIAGIVYQWVEGSIDKAGAAASGSTLPPPDDSGTDKFR